MANWRAARGIARSFAYLTRPLNTRFLISATRDAMVSYSVGITCTSTGVGGGQTGTVYLRLYPDATNPNWFAELGRGSNTNTQTAGGAVTLQQTVTITLSGLVPAGAYARISTDSNAGTPSFQARPGHEVLL